jgi:predicted exporter
MTPIRTALALAGLLAMLLAVTLEVDTDVRGLLGGDDRFAAVIDTREGRALTLAVIDPDIEKRSALAVEIAAEMAAHPLVRKVTAAPEPPGPEMIDWIWQNRFVLAPPDKAAFGPAWLVEEMRSARSALVSASDAVLAERYLRDPTGSFRRIVTALRDAAARALPAQHSVLQTRDGSAALVLFEMADEPLNVARQQAFTEELRARVEAGGAEALLVGPRAISAKISDHIAKQTSRAAMIACALLLLWLAFILRPPKAILICLLPPALGFLIAAILIQTIFGGVHVIALGFGGALLGLAMDYPLHLLAHRTSPENIRRSRRFVGLGVATTAIAFVALLGSGIPAIQQVGFFVASGLSVAALSAVFLANSTTSGRLRVPVLGIRPVKLRHKPLALGVIALICAVTLWQQPGQKSLRMFQVPPDIIGEIKRLDAMIGLPSARYRIDVSGASLNAVLARQAHLLPVLGDAASEGLISRAEMLASFLPERPEDANLPLPEAFSGIVDDLLTEAGFNPAFLDTIAADYSAAYDRAAIEIASLPQFDGFGELSSLIRVEKGRFIAPVRIWNVTVPDKLAERVAQAGAEGIRFVDQERSVTSGLLALSKRVSIWFVIGAVAGLLFLFLAIRRTGDVIEIFTGCLAAGLITLLVTSTIGGGLGVFHIVALTLVLGIGIDYGIFLTLSEDAEQYAEAMRSVLLCAITTLIAFLTMAFSGVTVLEEIGTTISIGVVAMVGANLARRRFAHSLEEK